MRMDDWDESEKHKCLPADPELDSIPLHDCLLFLSRFWLFARRKKFCSGRVICILCFKRNCRSLSTWELFLRVFLFMSFLFSYCWCKKFKLVCSSEWQNCWERRRRSFLRELHFALVLVSSSLSSSCSRAAAWMRWMGSSSQLDEWKFEWAVQISLWLREKKFFVELKSFLLFSLSALVWSLLLCWRATIGCQCSWEF